MSRMLTFAAASAFTLALGASPVLAQDFRALARQDLQKMHDELAANHPAPAVPGAASQAFRSWLDAGLQEALGMVGQVNSGDSHAYLLRYYAGGFRDSNIRVDPTFEGMGPYFGISWPGFTTGWRNGRYVVTYVKPGTRGTPRVGDAVVECNLTPIEEFARDKLDRWEGNLETEAGRVTTAPYLMWNRNNPFASGVPSVCSFQSGRGRPRDIQIRPVPVTAGDLEAAYRATVYMPPATPLAIETVNGRPWVHVHSFADSADWRAFNDAVEAQAATLQGPQGFVLDLRAARGSGENSSTARGYGLANRIWTPEFTVSRQPAAGDITYRATQGNRDWYAAALGRMEADPYFVQESMAVIEQTREIVTAFDAAIAAGQPTFTLAGRPAVPDTGAANPVQGPVIVLVDAGCSGGCLDTLDLLSKLPNVRIVGSTTATDSIFVEPTVLRLPSNYSDLSYGHKAWTSRPRANNQPYTPEAGLTYTGDPADENAVRAWVATLFQ
ncbi:MAG: hypothetical protein KKC29_01010 [Alphaproteobacteria bacterium]|jgi:hypothetical protein|nr:hypothetical protein [Alphaproteobacteria bacterium]MBU2041591.1 hypothetical protein [Alphaproteobacteria bacterium]MBU2125860.1 hypothetical protein [Alphaproteobacteria bacterium]MBU2209116.1 hypothetical protein [Alphaproteobacteria bacterium]MBU2289665.1 hypothetical protein [Alphaproteobacteria bacterium]